jgi:hypothetical protein
MNTPAPSPKLSPKQLIAFLHDQHAHYADDPICNYMSWSIEDWADQLSKAEKDLKDAQVEAAFLEQQQERRRYPERLELDARYGMAA